MHQNLSHDNLSDKVYVNFDDLTSVEWLWNIQTQKKKKSVAHRKPTCRQDRKLTMPPLRYMFL
jgi:hypothetical protein